MSWRWKFWRPRRRRVRTHTIYRNLDGIVMIVIHPREPERVRVTEPARRPAPEPEVQLALPLALDLEPAE